MPVLPFRFLWALLLAMLLAGPVTAQDGYEIFRGSDENSEIRIDYTPWNLVLQPMVMAVGPSNRYKGRQERGRGASRISISNTNPSWLEGSRVHFNQLTPEMLAAISEYRSELQALPARLGGMDKLSRREQLAYWLNLYNLVVFDEVAQRYPIIKLRLLRSGGASGIGLWDQKLIRVEGVDLSLNDIQNNILIPIFDDPLVLYGLYQGSVGGPNIRSVAYTGRNVIEKLELNALDFINSIRGIHLKGRTARISMIYEWGKAAFPGGEEDIRAHMMSFADAQTREILDYARNLRADYFDWYVTDLFAGRPMWGSMYSTMITTMDGFTRPENVRMPRHAQNFLRELATKFIIYGFPTGIVTIDEIESDTVDVPSEDTDEENERNQPLT